MTSVELTLTNFLFLGCLIAPGFLAIVLPISVLRKRSRQPRRIVALCVLCALAFAVNPAAQVLFLEPLDQRRGNEMARRAHGSELLGKTKAEARAVLGSPHGEYSSTPGKTTWEYKQLTGYWLSSHFKVFFDQDVVYYFGPNND